MRKRVTLCSLVLLLGLSCHSRAAATCEQPREPLAEKYVNCDLDDDTMGNGDESNP